MDQLPPLPGGRPPVFCAFVRPGRRRVGRRPLNAERRRERLLLVAAAARAVAPEGPRGAGLSDGQRLGAAEPVPDARDGRQPDVLQLDDLLLPRSTNPIFLYNYSPLNFRKREGEKGASEP